MRWSFVIVIFLSTWSLGQDCPVPEINRRIVQLVDGKIKKRVGKGECWDLAKYVLDETEASWDKWEKYGKLYDYRKDCILPGDIIQFDGVRLKWSDGKFTYKESMMHHTAVVMAVTSKNEIVIAHQNTAEHGRRVGKSTLVFDHIVKGKMLFYRPVPGK